MRKDDLRCFVAVTLAPALRKRLWREVGYLQLAGAHVKWVPADNMHMTIRFIGAVRAVDVMPVCDVIAEACAEAVPCRPIVRGLDTFPPGKPAPRVVVANVVGDTDPLKDLFNGLQKGLAEVGFKPERKGLHPHVTLGRVRESGTPEELMAKITASSRREFGVIDVQRVHLMMSDSTPDGPLYTSMKSFAIG